MTVKQWHRLLRGTDHAQQTVVAPKRRSGDVHQQVWRAAQDEADDAYAVWREHRGADAYLSYRAAADRADAALNAVIGAPGYR